MKVLIIDDEYLAPLERRRLQAEDPEVELSKASTNLQSGSVTPAELPPGLFSQGVKMVFIDGNMLLERLRDVTATIFVGGDGGHARVVHTDSIDDIFKATNTRQLPHSRGNLLEGSAPPHREDQQIRLRETDQVFISEGDRSWFIKLNEISLLESEGDYSRVHFRENRPLILRSLKVLEQRLDPGVFFRANRHQIVNLRWIKTLECAVNGNLVAHLASGAEVEMSRRQSHRLREMRTI